MCVCLYMCARVCVCVNTFVLLADGLSHTTTQTLVQLTTSSRENTGMLSLQMTIAVAQIYINAVIIILIYLFFICTHYCTHALNYNAYNRLKIFSAYL